jgi:hypothetical protein
MMHLSCRFESYFADFTNCNNIMDKNFAHFLKHKGYHPYELSPRDRKFFYLKDPEFISSYGPIFVEWFPEFRGTEVNVLEVDRRRNFVWGLHEKGHPPCLIYPRPAVLIEEQVRHYYSDYIIDRIFEKYTCEEIYRAIIGNFLLIL